MLRNVLLTGVVAIALGVAHPAVAREDASAPDSSAPASLAPMSPRADNATDMLGDPGSMPAPDAGMAMMGPSSDGSDALASFGPSSGTAVGNRALELRDEILRLRASVNLNSNQFSILRSSGAAGAVQYHSTMAAITARLQNGTTRGNPILLRQWDEANNSLDEVTTSLSRLNALQTAVDADASMATYLMESVQAAFQLSGAVDEDHDQLKLLRDEVSRMIVQLDYLRNQTTNDIQRQTTYLTTERANLQALAFAISRGELLGNSLANRPVLVNTPSIANFPYARQPSYPDAAAPAPMAAPPVPVAPGVVGGAAPMSPREYMQESGQAAPVGAPSSNASASEVPTIGQLLVLIRYNQPNVDYEQQLSEAVGTAMGHHPNAEFSVVAVSPASGDPADLAKVQAAAQLHADAVKRSLVQMGLSPSRITMAHTQTQTAQMPEVHVYMR